MAILDTSSDRFCEYLIVNTPRMFRSASSIQRHTLCDSISGTGNKVLRLRSASGQPTQAIFGFLSRGKVSKDQIKKKKEELLDVIAGLNRGVSADEIDRAKVDELAQELEKINPTKQPLKSPLVNGQWELIYTTSASIIGTKKPPYLRPQGPIYQLIDAENLKAANRETWPFFNQVDADLTPVSDSEVNVQFTKFKIFGLIPVTAPPSAKGSLSVSFLDDELRISRGDKGNLFVLTMDDRDKRP